jgi:hypothetical protein
MLMKSEFFTYQEILNVSLGNPQRPNQKSLSATWFSTFIDGLDLQWNILCLHSSFSSQVSEIINSLMTIVYDRHASDYIFRADYDFNEDYVLSMNDVKKVMSKIINVINLTAPKYIPLFVKYKDGSQDPIGAIKSTSKGKTQFNDTPQNIGDWGDDDHTTNISSSEGETSVDVGTLMERLASMYKDYKSIVLEWSNEFNQCFIKEEQLYV